MVGNKTDKGNRFVTEEDAAEMCDNLGAQHFLVSAKANQGVNEVFVALCRELLATSERAVRESLLLVLLFCFVLFVVLLTSVTGSSRIGASHCGCDGAAGADGMLRCVVKEKGKEKRRMKGHATYERRKKESF